MVLLAEDIQFLQLIKSFNIWTEILDDDNAFHIIYCDFMKAFDKVAHRRLIEKLSNYAIEKNYQNYIYAFLSERQLKVVVDGSKSSWKDVTSEMPPGSVLEPLLFFYFYQ